MMNTHMHQFTLRRLLLWTAVVAIWSGAFKMFSIGFSLSDPQSTTTVGLSNILIIAWVTIVVIVRAAFRARVAAATSIVAGVICAVWVFHGVSAGNLGKWALSNPGRATIAVVAFTAIGVAVFVCIEASFRMVDRIDRLMESKANDTPKTPE